MKSMVTIDESSSLFIVKEVTTGYKVIGYMQDDGDFGTGSKKWLNTLVNKQGVRIAKKSPMESKTLFNELNELLQKVITKYKQQNNI
jgi:hypothetical protein